MPTNEIESGQSESVKELSPLDVSMLSNHMSAEKCFTVVAENISCEGVSPFNETLQSNISLDMSLENSSINVSFLLLYKLIVLYELNFYICMVKIINHNFTVNV